MLLNRSVEDFFRMAAGVQQRCPLSLVPLVPDIFPEKNNAECFDASDAIEGRSLCNLQFADDIDLSRGSEEEYITEWLEKTAVG